MGSLKEVLMWIAVTIAITSCFMVSSYKLAYEKGVLTGRLIEIDAKVKLLEQNYYPAALPEEK